MKKFTLLVLSFVLSLNLLLRADEGMWIPMFIGRLNYEDMQKLGLKLTADEIYNINQSSLKDAIVQFSRGCTGEIISGQGLLLTNHHCGYSQIQSHSAIEHDYLRDGFWAMSQAEELPNPGVTATFLVRIEDVSQRVNGQLRPDMTEDQRTAKISAISDEIVREAVGETGYTASVKSFFGGNEFYLFVSVVYKDVRLVGAPPSSIGNFGGDTDNWMWPRHTGDFSLFRIYTGPDGEPAEYSRDNIPLKPKHFLPVSLDGYREGDFAMILGYPGSTDRYLSSWGVDLAIHVTNPSIVEIRQEKLRIMEKVMAQNDTVRIQYASKHNRISNYWKFYIGQTRGLIQLDVYEQKADLESRFRSWLEENPGSKAKYGEALENIENAYRTIRTYALAGVYYREAALRGPEILSFAGSFRSLADELACDDPDSIRLVRLKGNLKSQSEKFFKDYYLPIDRETFSAMMKLFSSKVPEDQQPAFLAETVKKYGGDCSRWAADVFEKSIFSSGERVDAFLVDPDLKTLQKDPAYNIWLEFDLKNDQVQKATEEANTLLKRGNRLFIAGLREMNPDRKYAPDANSTMRLTYGTIRGYSPADATYYDYFTTLDGVMEKEDPADSEFIVPDRLKSLYKAKDYGKYAEEGIMRTCFLADLDITGGNSGSPVINAKGELIGIAFDGNWEAMSGNIAFEPDYQRVISADIRYVLFIIDKFAGARHLINEMRIVKRMPALEPGLQSVKVPVEVEAGIK